MRNRAGNLSGWAFRLFAAGCISLATIALMAGCGGGGAGIAPAAVENSGRAFNPNYLSDLKSLSHWAQFPVSVYFDTGGSYTPDRAASATTGFDKWEQSTGGGASYRVVTDASQAQITVHFVDTLGGDLIGWTTWSYDDNGVITSANVRIAVTGLGLPDISWVGCHEIGHAMGLDGHSKTDTDVMFASHVVGSDWALTDRDVNTVKSDYYWLFAPSKATMPTRAGLPTHTVDVLCHRGS